ncbi:MAG: DNA mismatch repair protein MutS [Hellea sp.]
MNAPINTDKKAHKVTPMMAQFLGIKAEAGPDVLLFYRMGDFYELFFDDAVKAAEALDIALTKRGKHEGEDIAMCGVPVHSSETYLQRLIKKGFRVAVCEQTESPAEAKKRGYKSVVNRAIVRVVTPGTLTEDTLLDARGRNFILSLAKTLAGDFALAWADISDGQFNVCDVPGERLPSELSALSPREIVLPESLYQNPEFMETLPLSGTALTPQPSTKFDVRSGERRLKDRFDVQSLDGFGDFSKAEISAAGALLDYLELTQAGNPVQLSPPQRRIASGFMAIDPATRASLEIDRTQQGKKSGSLLSVIDKTVTGPGARLLGDRLARPLVDVAQINMRLEAVTFFTQNATLRDQLRAALKETGDMARSISRIALGRGGPRDMLTLGRGLQQGEQLCSLFARAPDAQLSGNTSGALDRLSLADKGELAKFASDIAKAFLPDVPMMARDGGFVASGWRPELDELKKLRDDSRRIVAGLQADYAKAANVPTLKIKHNNVLGYFVEVTPKYADAVLSQGAESQFIHRQTLGSCVRFTTTELAELDSKISGAGDKALALELNIFAEFVERAAKFAEPIRAAANALAQLDVQAGLAQWADDQNAVRPIVDNSLAFEVKGGRHPVVEAALKKAGSAGFTANDCLLDASIITAPRLTLITGPNMAGKSTYLRQNALMFILAQAGSFVPAASAHIGAADSLFSRVGASDDLSKGRSTFMIEMIETAAILNQATQRSFIILDEIGRGTATFDGLSIAWAAAEHLHAVNKSRALFATHYHELTDLIENLDGASNASLRAKEWDGDLVFLHDVRPGAADKSYGVQVAKLAGLPPAAVARAREVLNKLEADHDGQKDSLGGLPLFTASPAPVIAKSSEIETALKALDIDDLSPRAALDLLYDLKKKLN